MEDLKFLGQRQRPLLPSTASHLSIRIFVLVLIVPKSSGADMTPGQHVGTQWVVTRRSTWVWGIHCFNNNFLFAPEGAIMPSLDVAVLQTVLRMGSGQSWLGLMRTAFLYQGGWGSSRNSQVKSKSAEALGTGWSFCAGGPQWGSWGKQCGKDPNCSLALPSPDDVYQLKQVEVGGKRYKNN